ncbi:MAG TPA: SIMPL domain-containing protein [Blastocatellia bacterium]|nr:SIMPL domain-containing protein [Blastocatellia bacterium]
MIRSRILKAVLIIFAAAAAPAEELAQEPAARPLRSTIRVTGEATVSTNPDQAEINIGVVTQAATGQAAASQNAQKQDAVLAELRKMMGAAADIKTISYSLSPNYRYPKEGGQPSITGYTATNIVQVKTGNLTQVGKIIDVVTQSGANTIQSLRFKLKDEQVVRAQALGEAAIKARGKADALASALGLKILRVLQIEEAGVATPMPINTRAYMAEANAAVSTPVEPGTIEVHATITLTVEIAQ